MGCSENGHLLGPISPTTRMRICRICNAKVPAEGTYNITTSNGNLEVYPAGLFSQWEGRQIRRFLKVNLKAGDVMLHNWYSNCLYVFRASGSSQTPIEEEEPEDQES